MYVFMFCRILAVEHKTLSKQERKGHVTLVKLAGEEVDWLRFPISIQQIVIVLRKKWLLGPSFNINTYAFTRSGS
jgi:hypothetical protein